MDQKASKSKQLQEYVTVKIKGTSPSLRNSFLICGFLNITTEKMDIFYSTVINGEQLFDTDLSINSVNLVKLILAAKIKHDVQPENSQLVHDELVSRSDDKSIQPLILKYNSRDFGAIEFFYKKICAGVLGIDDLKVIGDFETVGHGTIEMVYAYEKLDKETVAMKESIASKYASGQKTIINKIIEEMPEDIVIIKFLSTSTNPILAGLIFYSNLINKCVSAIFISGPHDKLGSLLSAKDIVEFSNNLNELNSSGAGNASADAAIVNAITNYDSAKMQISVESSNQNEMHSLLSQILTPIAKGVKLNIEKHVFNSLVVDVIFGPPFKSGKKEEDDGEHLKKRINTIEVGLVLSPTKGKKLSHLKTGDNIQIQLNPENPSSAKLISTLGLKTGDRIKPLTVPIYSVKRDINNDYTILTKIGPNLYGKSKEEEDVKVRCDDLELESSLDTSSKSLVIGLTVGLMIIAIVLIFILFKK